MQQNWVTLLKNSLPPAPQASPEDLEVTLEEGVASLHSFLTTDSSSFLSVESSHFLPPSLQSTRLLQI